MVGQRQRLTKMEGDVALPVLLGMAEVLGLRRPGAQPLGPVTGEDDVADTRAEQLIAAFGGRENLVNVDAFCNAKESDYNCKDFKSQEEAMSVYNRCKTLGKNMDVYGLDGDKDGLVCESLPKTTK